MKMTGKKISTRTTLSLGLVIGMLGALPAAAADDTRAGDVPTSCSQETRRIAVWPKGGNPKFAQIPRYEERAVTVCNGKVVNQPQRNASNQ